VSGYFSKLLFPNAPRDVRRRKMQALRFGLVAGVFIAAGVALMFYLLYKKARP